MVVCSSPEDSEVMRRNEGRYPQRQLLGFIKKARQKLNLHESIIELQGEEWHKVNYTLQESKIDFVFRFLYERIGLSIKRLFHKSINHILLNHTLILLIYECKGLHSVHIVNQFVVFNNILRLPMSRKITGGSHEHSQVQIFSTCLPLRNRTST